MDYRSLPFLLLLLMFQSSFALFAQPSSPSLTEVEASLEPNLGSPAEPNLGSPVEANLGSLVEPNLGSPTEEEADSSEINEPITLVPADEADTLRQKLGKKPTLRYLSAPLSDGRTSILIPLPSDLDEKTGVVFVEDIRDGDLSQRTFRTHIFRPMKTSPISFNVKPADRNNRIRGARHSNSPNTINSIDKLLALSPPITTTSTTKTTTTLAPNTNLESERTTLEPEEIATETERPTTTTTTTQSLPPRMTRPPTRRVVNRRPISGSVRLEVRPISTTTTTTTTEEPPTEVMNENPDSDEGGDEMTTIESLRWVPSLSVGTLPTTTSSPTSTSTLRSTSTSTLRSTSTSTLRSTSSASSASTLSAEVRQSATATRSSSGRTRNRSRSAPSSSSSLAASLRVTDLVSTTLAPRSNGTSINPVSSTSSLRESGSLSINPVSSTSSVRESGSLSSSDGLPTSSVRESGSLSSSDGLPGTGGRDYPTFAEIPQTKFDCRNVQYPGFYADLETGCQVYHSCGNRGRRHSFLCPNGTIFSQEYLICDWWFNVVCSDSPNHFLLNKEAFSAVPTVKLVPLSANDPKVDADKDKVQ